MRDAERGVHGPIFTQPPCGKGGPRSTHLVLLELDPERLDAPVVIESEFPHLYGEIDPQAVALVRPYRPGPDGQAPLIAELAAELGRGQRVEVVLREVIAE